MEKWRIVVRRLQKRVPHLSTDPASAARKILEICGQWPALPILDFETTGLEHPAVIEVAVVGPHGVLYDSLVRPDRPMDVQANAVHQIPAKALANMAPWPVHVAHIQAILDEYDAVALGTWSGFEADVLAWEANRGAPMLRVQLIDLKRLYAALHGIPIPPDGGRIRGASLWRACDRYGVPQGTHRARQDCEATLGVWSAMQAEARHQLC